MDNRQPGVKEDATLFVPSMVVVIGAWLVAGLAVVVAMMPVVAAMMAVACLMDRGRC